MKIQLAKESWDSIECDALIVPVFENEDEGNEFLAALDERLGGLIKELQSTEEWTSGVGEISVIYRPEKLKTARLILLGAGKKESYDSHVIGSLMRKAVLKVKGHNLKRVAF